MKLTAGTELSGGLKVSCYCEIHLNFSGYIFGSVVLKPLCYKPKAAGSKPDEAN
jgi:hypothetical protein